MPAAGDAEVEEASLWNNSEFVDSMRWLGAQLADGEHMELSWDAEDALRGDRTLERRYRTWVSEGESGRIFAVAASGERFELGL